MSTVEAGYDPTFLGPPVPLPVPAQTVRTLPSTHFTVLLDPARRLAAATAVNIDGAQLVDLERGDDWHLDPRVPADEQAGPELYARNDLDRGHLVRRRDPVWGDLVAARRANLDTFAYPNAAPQASAFNQGELLWVGLEDHVLEYARTYGHRLSVFTGPVLADDDPVYRGVGIPRMFWKVAAWARARPRATAFVLDQTPVRHEPAGGRRRGARRSGRSARSRCPVVDVEDAHRARPRAARRRRRARTRRRTRRPRALGAAGPRGADPPLVADVRVPAGRHHHRRPGLRVGHHAARAARTPRAPAAP